MELPEDLKYTKDHEWCLVEDNIVTVGITAHAQEALGDIVFFDEPEEGQVVEKGEAFCVVESVKAVSDIYAPISGTVVAINDDVVESPETVNEDPYGKGWLVRIQLSNETELSELFDATQYQELLEES